MSKARRQVPHAEWVAEATKLFGPDPLGWRFVCPCCGHVASVADYKAAGAPEGAVGYSCIGRYATTARDAFDGDGPGPCNYAGGGLFRVHPVEVMHEGEPRLVFAFDGSELVGTDPA